MTSLGSLLLAVADLGTTGPSVYTPYANLAHILDPLFITAQTYEGTFVKVGYILLSIAFTLELMWTVIQFWIKGGAAEAVTKLFRMFFLIAIPLAMLATWPKLPNDLFSMFSMALPHVLTGATGSGTDQAAAALGKLFAAAAGLTSHLPTATGGGWISHIGIVLTHFLMSVILFIPIMLFGMALVFALYGPLLMLYIGVIMGPIVVPWLVWKPLSSLAMKWFSFMMSMGVAFVVGMLMASIMSQTLIQLNDVMKSAQGQAALVAVVGLMPILVIMLFMGYMLLKIEHIAGAIMGAAAIGAGGAFFASMANKAKGMGGKGGGGKGGGNMPSTTDAKPSGGAGGDGGSKGGGGDQASLSSSAGDAGGGGGKGDAGGGGGQADMSGDAAASGTSSSSESGTSSSPTSSGSTSGGGGKSALRRAMGATGRGSWAATKATGRGAKAFAGTGVGKAAMVSAAAVAAGPVGALAAGAYAVSPGLRKATGKSGGMAVKGAKGIGNYFTRGKSSKTDAAKDESGKTGTPREQFNPGKESPPTDVVDESAQPG